MEVNYKGKNVFVLESRTGRTSKRVVGYWNSTALAPYRKDEQPDEEAPAMAALGQFGSPPMFPIATDWDGPVYASLQEIGADFEFLDERSYVASGDPMPIFIDAAGRRYRILVVALEVVSCVEVPSDFDPKDLIVSTTMLGGGRRMAVEWLGATPHRGLELAPRIRPLSQDELASLRRGHIEGTLMKWVEFDEAWLSAVDPAPPIQLWPPKR